jgi:hypothetical protein
MRIEAKLFLAVAAVVSVVTSTALLIHAQPPAPGSASVATATVNVLVNGTLIGSTPILNFTPGNGMLVTAVPNTVLGSIDIGSNINSVVAPTFQQLYQNPIGCSSNNGTTGFVCNPTPSNYQGPGRLARIDLVTDTTCATTCTLTVVSGSGAGIAITQADGVTAPNGLIVAGQMKQLWFDGTVFRII